MVPLSLLYKTSKKKGGGEVQAIFFCMHIHFLSNDTNSINHLPALWDPRNSVKVIASCFVTGYKLVSCSFWDFWWGFIFCSQPGPHPAKWKKLAQIGLETGLSFICKSFIPQMLKSGSTTSTFYHLSTSKSDLLYGCACLLITIHS